LIVTSVASVLVFCGGRFLNAQPPAAQITPPSATSITPPPVGFTPPPTVAPLPLPRERFQVFATNATKLKKFSDAVKVMKSRPVSDKTSWAYWANIHGINGASNPDWNQCRHAQWWFVAWHRAYVLELEHQLQAAIHDPNFRLPYWDYLDAGQRKIPAAFKKTTSSLFESQRDGDEVGFETVDLQKTFSATKYLGSITAGGFGGASVSSGTISGPFSKRGRMEQNPHNTVHVDIGGLMGDPATAAQDPIFWVHHCNIDRIWEVWIKNGPHTNPAGAFTTETFTLPGVNGQPVTHKVADMFDTKKLGYTYDRTNLQVQIPGSTPPPPPAPKKAPAPASSPAMSEAEPAATPSAPPVPAETEEPLQPRVVLATAPKDKPITVANKPQTIKVAPEVVPAEHNMLRRDVDHKKAKKKVFLNLEGITFTEPPKHLYKVYLNLPNADHKVGPNAPQYVGTLAFFESHDGHHGNEGGGDRTETFDITDTLAAAKKAGNYDPNNLTVTIVPVGPPKDGKRLPPQNAKEITVKNISIKTADAE
jgi:tyrosinase